MLATKIDGKNSENLDARFLDWPSSKNKQGIHAGLQAMMVLSFTAGTDMCKILNEPETAKICENAIAKLKKYVPNVNKSKQAASLLSLAGMMDPKKTNDEVVAVGGAENFSKFYGYYMLKAKAKAGDYQGALNNIREYWRVMLNLGATTFWEDFDLKWLHNASRIDELVPEGKKDIHGDYGAYCYVGFRHSLCHGWASEPTPWLTEYVLGIKVVATGAKVIKIEPHLGDLTFVEGTYPSQHGLVRVKHIKLASGKIKTSINKLKEVKIIK